MEFKSRFLVGVRRAFILCTSFVLLSGCQSASQDPWRESDKIKVLCTTGMCADLVEAVGGERVSVKTLIGPDLDPHSYELVKGDLEKFHTADLIVANGLGLEHGQSIAKVLKESDKVVLVGNEIAAQDPATLLKLDGQTDPHIWMDVSIWCQGTKPIAAALCELDAENERDYWMGAHKKICEMCKLDEEIIRAMARVPADKRFLVSCHDAFGYFARRYLSTGLEYARGNWRHRVIAPEGLSPESQLSPKDMRLVLNHLSEHNIHVVFAESNLSHDSVAKLVRVGKEQGLDIQIAQDPLYGDAMGQGNTYNDMMWHNTEVLTKNLSR